VQVFVANKAAVDTHTPAALKALKPGGALWFVYPKKSSGIKTDISRDTGWEVLNKAGFEPVTLISVNDIWSAFRLRPVSEIKVMTRKKRTLDQA
jgi:hypothetical protein